MEGHLLRTGLIRAGKVMVGFREIADQLERPKMVGGQWGGETEESLWSKVLGPPEGGIWAQGHTRGSLGGQMRQEAGPFRNKGQGSDGVVG